jgi:membrane protein
MMTVEMLRPLFVKAWKNWGKDKAPRLSASLTFYLMLALAPLLLFIVAGAGLFYSSAEVRHHLIRTLEESIGSTQAHFIESIIVSTSSRTAGITATLFSLAISLFGSSGLIEQLRDSMNSIWGVDAPSGGIWSIIVRRLVGFLTVIVGTLILVAWLLFDAWLRSLRHRYGGGTDFPIWEIISFLTSWIFWTPVFGSIFKFLPEIKVKWNDVWLAAIVTSLGFALGKYVLSLYFSYSTVNLSYGSAGAIVVILLWSYYFAQLFFYGVELSEAYSLAYGSRKGQQELDSQTVEQHGLIKVRT